MEWHTVLAIIGVAFGRWLFDAIGLHAKIAQWRTRNGGTHLDSDAWPMHDACMATKTISLRLDAYERLRRARLHAGESFTEVVLRAQWPDRGLTAGELRDTYEREGALFSDEFLERVEDAVSRDEPPSDKWTEG